MRKARIILLFVFKNFVLIAFSDIHTTKYSDDFVKMLKNAGRDWQKNKQIWFSFIFCLFLKIKRVVWKHIYIFMHLADAFIQSDLQCIQAFTQMIAW